MMHVAQAPLARPELRTYEAELPRMLAKHEGQYVVIHGDQIADYFKTYSDALTWAYSTYGLDPFFVKQVFREQHAVHYTRDLGPCR